MRTKGGTTSLRENSLVSNGSQLKGDQQFEILKLKDNSRNEANFGSKSFI